MKKQNRKNVAAAKAAEKYKDYPVRPEYGSDLVWEELRGWNRWSK